MEQVDINILIKIKIDLYQEMQKKEVNFGMGLQRLWQNNGGRKKYKTKMVSKSLEKRTNGFKKRVYYFNIREKDGAVCYTKKV